MKKNRLLLQILIVLSSLLFCSICSAVETRDIDNVRSKSILNEDDLGVIDKFVSNAINELVATKDFTAFARLRSVIVSRQGEQAQYAEQYSTSCREHISRALEKTIRIESESEKNTIRMNLLILIDNLEDPRLVDLAIEALNDKSPIVRYWALHTLTRPKFLSKIKSEGPNSDTKRKLFVALEGKIDNTSYQEMGLLVDFADSSDTPETEQLLLKIADSRIKKYADWTVNGYLADIGILKNLFSKMTKSSDSQAKQEFGSRFGQLYSYAMQKYIRNISGGNFLSDSDKQQLISTLVEIEDKCIGKLTGLQQTQIKTAVENNDFNSLIMENGRLFGDETQNGVIPDKFGFDYGTSASGAKIRLPAVLPEAPSSMAAGD